MEKTILLIALVVLGLCALEAVDLVLTMQLYNCTIAITQGTNSNRGINRDSERLVLWLCPGMLLSPRDLSHTSILYYHTLIIHRIFPNSGQKSTDR
jgi:hypothetical protein